MSERPREVFEALLDVYLETGEMQPPDASHRAEWFDSAEAGGDLLWSCTFTDFDDSALDRYYSTYSICADGMWSGLAIPPRSKWHRIQGDGRVLDDQLKALGMFEELYGMWNDAMQAALQQVLKIKEEPC